MTKRTKKTKRTTKRTTKRSKATKRKQATGKPATLSVDQLLSKLASALTAELGSNERRELRLSIRNAKQRAKSKSRKVKR